MTHTQARKPANPRKLGARRRLKLLGIPVMVIMVWAGVTLWNQMGKLQEKSGQLQTLQTKLNHTIKLNADVKKEVERLNDKEAREEKIRQDMHYSKKGETLFDVPQSKP
jgi:cell division protein DivIC